MRRVSLVAAIMLAVFAGATAASAQTQYQKIVTSEIGCREWATYEKIMDYVVRKDDDGYMAFTLTAISAGECVIFQLGQPVVIVERGIASVKLRPKGTLAEYWTVRDAIDLRR
jgi:hypothetical protein